MQKGRKKIVAEINFNVIEQTAILHVKQAFTTEECKAVSDAVMTYKNKSPSFDPNANLGCWRGWPHVKGGFTEEMNNMIIDRCSEAINEYMSNLAKPTNTFGESTEYLDKSRYVFDAWFNVNRKGAENREHSHSGFLASGVAYFQATDTGPIEFLPLNALYKMTNPAWPYHGMANYEPSDGDILIFPSYLLHKVHPNPNEKERINMAFNVNYRRKDIQQ